VLRELDLEQVAGHASELDKEQDWGSMSLGQQQLLAIANVLLAAPQFVFMDRMDTALSSKQLHSVLRLFSKSSITCINSGEAGEADDARDHYQEVLQYTEDGRWTWTANPA
jgi:putative ATP-binding cassette transporter